MNAEELKQIKKAEALIEVNRVREAVSLLIKVLGNNPQNFHAACLLALCFIELKEHEKALQYAEKAIEIAPENDWGHRLRSIALGELGRLDESLKSAQEAIRLTPDEPNALIVLINAQLRRKKPEEAKHLTEKLLEIAPDSEDAHLTAGNVYLDLQYYHQAEKHFREALRINPASFDARNNLGVVFVRKHPEAGLGIEHFAEAVKLDPAKALALENLRIQLSIIPQIAGFVVFLPIAVIGTLIVPVFALGLILGFGSLIQQIIQKYRANAEQLQNLPEEFRIRFKSENFKTRFSIKAKLFWTLALEFFLKVWLVYFFAFAALTIWIFFINSGSSGLWFLSVLVFAVGCFVYYKKFKVKESENKIFEG